MLHIYIGVYFTGDGALRDENGLYRISGRVDDIIISKGHRIGTAELECAMVRHTHTHTQLLSCVLNSQVYTCTYLDMKRCQMLNFNTEHRASCGRDSSRWLPTRNLWRR